MTTKPKGPLHYARQGVKEYKRWEQAAAKDPENGAGFRSPSGKLQPHEEKSFDKSFDHGSMWVEYESPRKREEQKEKKLHQYGSGHDMSHHGEGKPHKGTD